MVNHRNTLQIIENQDLGMLDMILSRDADLKLNVIYNHWTPLSYAVSCEWYEGVELMLKRGANPNMTDDSGNTPLHFTACNETTNIAGLLLDNGSNQFIKNNKGHTVADYAIGYGNNNRNLYELLMTFRSNDKISNSEK